MRRRDHGCTQQRRAHVADCHGVRLSCLYVFMVLQLEAQLRCRWCQDATEAEREDDGSDWRWILRWWGRTACPGQRLPDDLLSLWLFDHFDLWCYRTVATEKSTHVGWVLTGSWMSWRDAEQCVELWWLVRMCPYFIVCLELFRYFSIVFPFHCSCCIEIVLYVSTFRRFSIQRRLGSLGHGGEWCDGVMLTYADGQQPTVTIGNQHLNHLTASSLRRTPLRESTWILEILERIVLENLATLGKHIACKHFLALQQ